MQLPAWHSHVGRRFYAVQCGQLQTQAGCMCSLNVGFRACLKKVFNFFVRKALYYGAVIVVRYVTHFNTAIWTAHTYK